MTTGPTSPDGRGNNWRLNAPFVGIPTFLRSAMVTVIGPTRGTNTAAFSATSSSKFLSVEKLMHTAEAESSRACTAESDAISIAAWCVCR